MVKKGGSNLNNIIQPYNGDTNASKSALNDGINSDNMHTEMLQIAGSGSYIEYPTFSNNSEASNASKVINTTLIENVNNSNGDSLTGGKKNKSKKSKSKSKKNKSKSKKSKSKKSKSKSKKSKSKKRV